MEKYEVEFSSHLNKEAGGLMGKGKIEIQPHSVKLEGKGTINIHIKLMTFIFFITLLSLYLHFILALLITVILTEYGFSQKMRITLSRITQVKYYGDRVALTGYSTEMGQLKEITFDVYEKDSLKEIKKALTLLIAPVQLEEQFTKQKHTKSFHCPYCQKTLWVSFFKTENVINCRDCHHQYTVSIDDQDNLYIYIPEEEPSPPEQLTLEKCFDILKVDSHANVETIKMAYKREIKAYHPDKVAQLGDDLQTLAEQKSKEINAAFTFLKKAGIC